jgi:hypothetical protein
VRFSGRNREAKLTGDGFSIGGGQSQGFWVISVVSWSDLYLRPWGFLFENRPFGRKCGQFIRGNQRRRERRSGENLEKNA